MSEQVLSLLLFAVAMTVSPGSNNALMATSGVQAGLRGSVPLGLGVVTGIVILLVIAALGLGTLVHAVPAIGLGLKVAGTAYLAWLGWRIAWAGPPSAAAGGRRQGFAAGLVNSLLNPKGWSMALGAVAGYAALAPSAPRLALLLSAVFAAVAVPNWFLWCGGGQVISRVLRTERHWRTANVALGLLVALSVVPLWLEA